MARAKDDNWGTGEANAWLVQQWLNGRSIESLSQEFEIDRSRIEGQMRRFVWVWTQGSTPLTSPLSEESCRIALERFEAEGNRSESPMDWPTDEPTDEKRRREVREERERWNAAEEAKIARCRSILRDIAQIDRTSLESNRDLVSLGLVLNDADASDRRLQDYRPEHDIPLENVDRLARLIEVIEVGYEHGDIRHYWDTVPPTPIPNTRKLVWSRQENRANAGYESDVLVADLQQERVSFVSHRVLISRAVLERLREICRERVKLRKASLEDRVRQHIVEVQARGERPSTSTIDKDPKFKRSEREQARSILSDSLGKRGRRRPRKFAK